MGNATRRGGRQDVEREIEERTGNEQPQGGGSMPEEIERGMESEPGVEWHAGEDAGEVPAREDEDESAAAGVAPA